MENDDQDCGKAIFVIYLYANTRFVSTFDQRNYFNVKNP